MEQINEMGRRMSTDVLVVGGAGAGATAAVAAARGGARVVLVCKGKLGSSGNTIMAGAGISMDGRSAFEYGEDTADPSHTPEQMFEKIVKEAFYLSDQDVVQQYVDYAGRAVHEYIEWGRRAKQTFFFTGTEYVTSGKALGLAARQGVRETSGIEVVNDVMIQDILITDGRVAGAIGIDVYRGHLLLIEAKAVVLATGGYQPYSFKCTVSDMTGDGMAMAYRAGAQLADMEFQLSTAGIMINPRIHRGSIFAGFILLTWDNPDYWPETHNIRGERLEDKIPPRLMELARTSEAVKLIYTYYAGKEIAAGLGTANDGFHLYFSKMPPEEFEKGIRPFKMIQQTWYRQEWRYQGGDFNDIRELIENDQPIEVGISNEYSMGGIVVDPDMKTGVPGLLAAGEVTSGVFGAARVADATTEMVVQGFKAGETAAEYIKGVDEPKPDPDQMERLIHRIAAPLQRKEGIEAIRIQKAIEKTSDEGFYYLRNDGTLRTTLAEIERIRDEELPRVRVVDTSPAYNYEWVEALQVENLLTCTEAGVRAALMRTESRGFHIREDYPEVDNDKWLVKIIAADRADRMSMTTRSPTVTRMPLPTGRLENIMAYVEKYETD
jgi:succinate dehydrogenase / fumarate reductase flavoprotein subunit